MALRWWEWKHIQERLRDWGRALQGVDPYGIEFADEPGLTGVTDFARRLVRVNPEMLGGLKPRDAYEITKAVLCHEAAHRRFTAPAELSAVVHIVANILEDQRIESLIMEEFAGTRRLIGELTAALYDRSPELEANDDPGQVIAAALQWRWAVRLGVGLKGELSDINRDRWEHVRPLAEEAWSAETSEDVNDIAARIVEMLGITEVEIPAWVLRETDRCAGSRQAGDVSETRAPAASGPVVADEDAGEAPATPFDGEVLPSSRRVGTTHPIEPMPYAALELAVTPLADELIEEQSTLPVDDAPEPSQRGGALSVRNYIRDRAHPFLVEEGDRLAPPIMAVRVVVDHSTSMNHATAGCTRIRRAAEAAMMLHLALTRLDVDHAISIMPQQVQLADRSSGELGKALIAGMIPAKTGYEDLAIALRLRADELLAAPADVRLLFVLHDGYPNDGEKAKPLCESLRGRVEVIGVLLDPDTGTEHAMREIFGADRLVACPARDLPKKLALMLEAIRGE
jgi:hypothetical protein